MRPVEPPPRDQEQLLRALERFADIEVAPSRRYLHWDKLQYLPPPEGLTTGEWWQGVRFRRMGASIRLPLIATDERPMTYVATDLAARRLLRIDQQAAGNLGTPDELLTPGLTRQRFLFRSITEEAIRSSQLEGAQTERRIAKAMIASGRAPSTQGERMILNNYRALEFAREEMNGELSLDQILRLHRVLTDGTLEDPRDAGRIQGSGEERVVVTDRVTNEVIHVPPDAEHLGSRLEAMLRFANASDEEPFLHPVVRACLLHFWLAYDHPFVDGNGRTARALFYWSMRRSGYWLTDFLSISARFYAAPGQYTRSFLETETDDGDTTYFVLHHLEAIDRAIDDLHAYVERKAGEIASVERLTRDERTFNRRQLQLLAHALRDPDASYTFGSHAILHRLTKPGARNDLLGLEAAGLLSRATRGREHVFRPVSDLAQRLTRRG